MLVFFSWYGRPHFLTFDESEAIGVLIHPKSATLYYIDPIIDMSANKTDCLYRHRIVGKAVLNSDEAAIAGNEFRQSTYTWFGFGIFSMDCFDPRHALRIESDGHTYDFLLCYQCHSLAIYKDGEGVGDGLDAGGYPNVLNGLLKVHGAPFPLGDNSDIPAAVQRLSHNPPSP